MINVQLAFPVAQCLKLTSRQCLTLCFFVYCLLCFDLCAWHGGMGAWKESALLLKLQIDMASSYA